MATAIRTTDVESSPTAVWDIAPSGFFSRHFALHQDGKHVVTLQMALWQEGGKFTITDHEFAVRRPSLWKDAFQLLVDDVPVCDARRDFWSRRFELQTADRQWVLQTTSLFSTSYQLLAGHEKQGRIDRSGWFSRRRIAKLSSVVPPPVQVLAIFLVLIVAQRQSKAN